MSLKSIIYGDPPCQNANNNRICHSIIDNYFNDHCLGQNNCTLPVQILSNNSCQPPPRRLKVKFKCDSKYSYFTHSLNGCIYMYITIIVLLIITLCKRTCVVYLNDTSTKPIPKQMKDILSHGINNIELKKLIYSMLCLKKHRNFPYIS